MSKDLFVEGVYHPLSISLGDEKVDLTSVCTNCDGGGVVDLPTFSQWKSVHGQQWAHLVRKGDDRTEEEDLRLNKLMADMPEKAVGCCGMCNGRGFIVTRAGSDFIRAIVVFDEHNMLEPWEEGG